MSNTKQRAGERDAVRHSGHLTNLTGGASLRVPPQPASDWSRDGQLVGGEVLRLLGVCGRKQSVSGDEVKR